MRKLIAILFCLGLLTACNSESSKKDAASDAAKIEASQTSVPATSTETTPASPPAVTSTNSELSTDIRSQIERDIQNMQQNLPIKMNGVDLTEIKLENNTIYQSFNFTDKNITSKKVPLEQLKQRLLMGCNQPDIKRFLSGGYDFLYTYHFQDKSKVEIRMSAKDCQ